MNFEGSINKQNLIDYSGIIKMEDTDVKVVLFIAMSLDGYIADQYGNVDWLAGEEPDRNDMESYDTFIQDIDTVVMGWNTYHQIVTELSPGLMKKKSYLQAKMCVAL